MHIGRHGSASGACRGLSQRGMPSTFCPRMDGLDHGIGHLASMSPQKNERLLPSKGCNAWATSASLAMLTKRRGIDKGGRGGNRHPDRKSTRLNSSHGYISYAVFCLKKKKN